MKDCGSISSAPDFVGQSPDDRTPDDRTPDDRPQSAKNINMLQIRTSPHIKMEAHREPWVEDSSLIRGPPGTSM